MRRWHSWSEGLGASGQPSGHLTKSHVHLQLHDVRWMLTPPSWRPESQPRPAGCRGPLPGLQVHLLGLTWPFLCGERGTQPRQSRVCPVTSSDLNLLPKAQLLRSPPGRGLPRCVHLGFVGRTEKRGGGAKRIRTPNQGVWSSTSGNSYRTSKNRHVLQ